MIYHQTKNMNLDETNDYTERMDRIGMLHISTCRLINFFTTRNTLKRLRP
jgi:hypothetical protein